LKVLGEGAFSRVCKVTEESTGRPFAMKRMSKAAAMQCPDHVYCEQRITRNMAHPFCLRQYASFKVRMSQKGCSVLVWEGDENRGGCLRSAVFP
jgi:serine/threonine protein kinase